jgi:hypothetical protein
MEGVLRGAGQQPRWCGARGAVLGAEEWATHIARA